MRNLGWGKGLLHFGKAEGHAILPFGFINTTWRWRRRRRRSGDSYVTLRTFSGGLERSRTRPCPDRRGESADMKSDKDGRGQKSQKQSTRLLPDCSNTR